MAGESDEVDYDDAGAVIEAALDVLDEHAGVVIDTGVTQHTVTESSDLWMAEEGHENLWVDGAGVHPTDVEAIRPLDTGLELRSAEAVTWVDDDGVRYRRTMGEDGPVDEPISLDAEVAYPGEIA